MVPNYMTLLISSADYKGCIPHPYPASIINDCNHLKMQVGYNCPYSDDDKINADYIVKYFRKNHYDDATNKSDNSP